MKKSREELAEWVYNNEPLLVQALHQMGNDLDDKVNALDDEAPLQVRQVLSWSARHWHGLADRLDYLAEQVFQEEQKENDGAASED